MKAVGVHVVVKPIQEDSGVFATPEQQKGEPVKGDVLHVGRLCERDIEVGDVVVFRKYSTQDFEHGGETICFIEDVDILGKYGEEEEG